MTAPVPAGDRAARRARAREELRARELDVLLVTDPRNVRYLSGFSGSAGAVLLGRTAGDDRLVTDERYTARAASEAPDLEMVRSRDPGGAALSLAAQVAGAGRGGSGGRPPRLGVEADHLSWAAARELERRGRDAVPATRLVPTGGLVEVLRAVKDDVEVAAIAAACELTVQALERLFEQDLRVGRTERQLATALERRFVDLGADGVAFPSIVASGPNGAVPHHAPGDRRLEPGDLVTVDGGAMVDGYHADCTRTVALGTPDPGLAEVHAVVVRAQAAGRDAARAGIVAGAVDAAARDVLEDAGYGAAFVHGTGHGVGLAIHEHPPVARGARATLAAGTVLTVEPGVYLPGRGGVRIEDTLVIVPDGPPRVLTDLARDLRVLPA